MRMGVVDSTLRVLADTVAQTPDLPDLSTVVATHQTAGRGRSGRTWVDAEDSALLIATLVRLPEENLSWITPLAGLAMVNALADEGFTAELKWPNDILVNNHKVAGILCEHLRTDDAPSGGRLHSVAVGLGLNLGEVPAEAGPLAGALELPEATPASAMDNLRKRLLRGFLNQLDHLIDASEPQIWRRQYKAHLAHLGQPSTVHLPDGRSLAITALDVDIRGGLHARLDDGTTLTITAGDVELPVAPTSHQLAPASVHPTTAHTPQEGTSA